MVESLIPLTTKFLEIYSEEIILRDELAKDVASISRIDSKVSSKQWFGEEQPILKLKIFGVYGIIHLPVSSYLLVITQAGHVGDILSRKLFQLQQITIIPISKDIGISSINIIPAEDQTFIEMLNNFFKKRFMYFSYEYDLTTTIQIASETNFAKNHSRNHFFYNHHIIEDFIKAGCTGWVLPVISGYIEVHDLVISNQECQFILISRRDKSRAGMRWVSRGTDLDGNVSNAAETEQILVLNRKMQGETKLYSFIQIRGSLPFMWTQTANLKWSPKAIISTPENNVDVARKHLEKTVNHYGPVVLANLIDKKGTQKRLGEEYKRVVEAINNPKLKYIWFDFHYECRGMKYENLSKLLAQFETDLENMKYTEATFKGTSSISVSCKQYGTVRTNCVDSLDRTNVVQSVIARRVLHRCLKAAELSKSSENIGPFEKLPDTLETIFREAWTNNANAMSILYTGTNAQKTDFTRLGKRTFKGMIDDGRASIERFIKGNFYDGYNQDCVDLVLGRLNPKQTKYQKKRSNFLIFMMLQMVIAPVLIKKTLDVAHVRLFDQNHSSSLYQYTAISVYYVGFLAMFGLIYNLVAKNHRLLVQKPHLKH